MSEQLAQRELVLITNHVIADSGLSPMEVNGLMTRFHYCELGSPEKPSVADWAPALFTPQDVRDRIERYKTINHADVIATISDLRIDVAGNLVGKVLIKDGHPKSETIKKKIMQPKCGIVVHPRIGYEYGSFNRRDTKVFGFDVGFK